MLRHTSSLKGVLIVAIEIFRSRQKFQHKCKEVMSRHSKLGCESTSQLNTENSYRGKENGLQHEDRLKADKLCRDQIN